MRCVLCGFDAEPDDVQLVSETGRCICERCYERETDTRKPMPKGLRRLVEQVLRETEEKA